MKKFNLIALAIAAIAAAVLLVLWFVLGFNHVDAPVDFVIAVLWWLLITGVAYGIIRVEQKRRERIRTVYVADDEMFNPERGAFERPSDPSAVARAAEETVRDLTYGFSIHTLPDENERPSFTYVIRTFAYDPDNKEWSGEVVFARDPKRKPSHFESRAQLASALAS